MKAHAIFAQRSPLRLLIGFLAALCLAVPVLAARDAFEEQTQPAKVAKKMQQAQKTAGQAEDEREALRHFRRAVAEYAELHAKQLATLPAQESVGTQKALALALKAKRAKARPGDFFEPEILPLFRRLLAEQLEGPAALDARESVMEGNPGHSGSAPVVARVNAEYPLGAARSTVPPSVLLTLPPLPEALHYRFVGRNLVLVDSVAQLIVDVLPAAVPLVAAK